MGVSCIQTHQMYTFNMHIALYINYTSINLQSIKKYLLSPLRLTYLIKMRLEEVEHTGGTLSFFQGQMD